MVARNKILVVRETKLVFGGKGGISRLDTRSPKKKKYFTHKKAFEHFQILLYAILYYLDQKHKLISTLQPNVLWPPITDRQIGDFRGKCSALCFFPLASAIQTVIAWGAACHMQRLE